MAFVRVKTIKGRDYRYLVRAQREGDRVSQKVVRYLGPAEPVYKVQRKRKSNAWLFARNVTGVEREELNCLLKSKNGFVRDRAKIVMLSSSGMQCRRISEKLDFDERKVRFAVKAFNEKRLAALCRKKRVYTKKVVAEQRLRIVEAALKDPVKLGLPFSTWSLPKLKSYAVKNGIVSGISVESIRKIVKENGVKLKKSRRFQYSNDPDILKKSGS